jgi:hypothetical protein
LRIVEAAGEGVGDLAKVDKPTYTAEIYVKYNGGGSFTYNFPFGTDFASASANFDRDEVLSIALTPDQTVQTVRVRMLPSGGVFGKKAPVTIVTVQGQNPESRLDAIQLEQSLRNLQLNTN